MFSIPLVFYILYMLILYYSSQYRRTALYYVSKGGHHDTVIVLLEKGADSNTRDKVSGVYIMHTCIYDRVRGNQDLSAEIISRYGPRWSKVAFARSM